MVNFFSPFFFGMISSELSLELVQCYGMPDCGTSQATILASARVVKVLMPVGGWGGRTASKLCPYACSSRVIFYERICIPYAQAGLRLGSNYPR